MGGAVLVDRGDVHTTLAKGGSHGGLIEADLICANVPSWVGECGELASSENMQAASLGFF